MRVLAIDYGAKRVGHAVSDTEGITAFPGGVISWQRQGDLIRQIAGLVQDKEADKVVVGLPLDLSGQPGHAARQVLDFVARLRNALPVPVDTFDERLSTVRAERSMLAADLSRAKRAKRIDAVAAAIFLQVYLDRERAIHISGSDPET